MREQHDVAIGELNRIVMRAWIIHVDLPESSNPVTDMPRFLLEKTQEKSGLLSLDVLIESNLGAGKKTHGHLGLSDCRETLRGGVPKLR